MGSERIYRTEGIVVRRRDQGEADRVLTLCTPLGKLEVIARGARKIRSRKAAHIELFARSHFVIARAPRSWDVVSQAETIEPRTILRSDLARGAYARYAAELLDRFFTEGEGGPALFDLFDHALDWLCQDDDLDMIARFYEQHLLALAGFRPELNVCVSEVHARPVALQPQRMERDRPCGFDPERGGALCPDCYDASKARPEVKSLSPAGLRFLQECQAGPYARLRDRKAAPALRAEVERVMQHYITYHLERAVRSASFLRRLKRDRRA